MNPKVIYQSEKVKDLLIIQLESFEDWRGYNFEAYNEEVYNNLFQQKLSFPVDSYSRSIRNVIRGLHGDKVNWKLVEVLTGRIFLVVVDVREDSPTYMGLETITLSYKDGQQILLPPGCVNGHCVLSKKCLFHYRLSVGFTAEEDQLSFKWNDPTLKITWPISVPILSLRDE